MNLQSEAATYSVYKSAAPINIFPGHMGPGTTLAIPPDIIFKNDLDYQRITLAARRRCVTESIVEGNLHMPDINLRDVHIDTGLKSRVTIEREIVFLLVLQRHYLELELSLPLFNQCLLVSLVSAWL